MRGDNRSEAAIARSLTRPTQTRREPERKLGFVLFLVANWESRVTVARRLQRLWENVEFRGAIQWNAGMVREVVVSRVFILPTGAFPIHLPRPVNGGLRPDLGSPPALGPKLRRRTSKPKEKTAAKSKGKRVAWASL